ncbi:MAG: Bax inhibitor-1/YccA family protein [Myxococcales bacterium]|nr:Bax inhibitor-1/YccA family protein [Myxococcales bacterium]
MQLQVSEAGRQMLMRTYMWMFAALCVTGVVGMYVVQSRYIITYLFQNPTVMFGLLVGELLLVGVIAGMVHRMSLPVAMGTFFFYAALNGVTLAPLAFRYTSASIANVFFITAGMFAVTTVYGYTTKRDLSGVGHFAIMGLIGIIIASIVNIFMGSPALYWMISYIGVVVFVLLTAYDTQMIVQMGEEGEDSNQMAIYGALELYLDFVNLFILLLRIFGNRD